MSSSRTVAGIVVFREQGTAPGAGVNLYTSAAPVLVAIPAVVVVLRLYPLALRRLLRSCGHRRGAVAFLGLARADRIALTPALPAFALVVALSMAAFAGTVRDAGNGISPAAQRAAAAVPGVTHAAGVLAVIWTTANDLQLTGIAVDPASTRSSSPPRRRSRQSRPRRWNRPPGRSPEHPASRSRCSLPRRPTLNSVVAPS